jgi:hypothetical protein
LKNVCWVSFEVNITQNVAIPIYDHGNELEQVFENIFQNSANGGELTPSSDFGEG